MKEDRKFSASSLSEGNMLLGALSLMSKIVYKAKSMKINTEFLDTFLDILVL